MLLKRVTTVPASPLRVMVSQPEGEDAGLSAGGTYYFMPAGEDGSAIDVPDYVADAILSDPGLAVHFQGPVAPTAAAADASEEDPTSK